MGCSGRGMLGCGMLGMWDVWNVPCWGYIVFGMRNVQDVEYSGCEMFGMWNVQVVVCSGCGMFEIRIDKPMSICTVIENMQNTFWCYLISLINTSMK